MIYVGISCVEFVPARRSEAAATDVVASVMLGTISAVLRQLAAEKDAAAFDLVRIFVLFVDFGLALFCINFLTPVRKITWKCCRVSLYVLH